MKFTIIAFITFGLLLAFVQCRSRVAVTKYEIKQGSIFTGGRSYDIKSKTTNIRFSIENELLRIGKKLTLLENGKPRYIVTHKLLNLWSTWSITDAITGREVGQIKNKFKVIGAKIHAEGDFGKYVIKGEFGKHTYKISKNHHKVAQIHKDRFHLHDTYGLKVYGNEDQALMILFAIVVDEIRQH
ncbi:unnamed protein product [Adineta steineri]|uniref:Uncharacterized protein n=1 Tax=Adineta steineri TaxID=433720 RepID=A0A814EYE2_9BILA|nr:unnamed protein product [Adineta steineri]CAF1488949.1 unnamed protein product [Adineta steineri]